MVCTFSERAKVIAGDGTDDPTRREEWSALKVAFPAVSGKCLRIKKIVFHSVSRSD